MRSARRVLFPAFLLSGLGGATTLVVALLVSQFTFSGSCCVSGVARDGGVRSAMVLSFACATAAAGLALFVAVPAAYALTRWRFRGAVLLDAVLDVPVILSPVALGLSLLLLLRSSPGQWIEEHVVQFIFAVPGILLAQFVMALALEIRVLKSAFEEVDPRLEQVARFLGCTPAMVFRRVSLPLVKPGLLAAFVLGWSRAIGDFGATAMVAGGVRGKTETMPIAIYLSLASVRLEKAVAMAFVLTVVALVVLIGVRLCGRAKR